MGQGVKLEKRSKGRNGEGEGPGSLILERQAPDVGKQKIPHSSPEVSTAGTRPAPVYLPRGAGTPPPPPPPERLSTPPHQPPPADPNRRARSNLPKPPTPTPKERLSTSPNKPQPGDLIRRARSNFRNPVGKHVTAPTDQRPEG